MNEDVQFLLDEAKEQMENAITHLESELSKIRAGKASPAMLDGVMVDYYGTKTPLNQVANVNSQDARSLVVQPWEKSMIDPIVKGIQMANLGLNPQDDGTLVRILVPSLTEERRKELVKKAKAEAENCRVTLRNVRRDANETIKKLQKNGMPEDEAKEAETKTQDLTNTYTARCDKHLETKEKEIMTI